MTLFVGPEKLGFWFPNSRILCAKIPAEKVEVCWQVSPRSRRTWWNSGTRSMMPRPLVSFVSRWWFFKTFARTDWRKFMTTPWSAKTWRRPEPKLGCFFFPDRPDKNWKTPRLICYDVLITTVIQCSKLLIPSGNNAGTMDTNQPVATRNWLGRGPNVPWTWSRTKPFGKPQSKWFLVVLLFSRSLFVFFCVCVFGIFESLYCINVPYISPLWKG